MNPMLKILLRLPIERIREEIRRAQVTGKGDRRDGYISGLKTAPRILGVDE